MKNWWNNQTILLFLFFLSTPFILSTLIPKTDDSTITVIYQNETINDSDKLNILEGSLPLRFKSNISPFFAQENILFEPGLPLPGELVNLCIDVINDDFMSSHLALLQFSESPLGIGLPGNLIGSIEILVPPGDQAIGCVTWINPDQFDRNYEVLLYQEGSLEPLHTQRNIDINPLLQPGVTDSLTFPVGNPLDHVVDISLGLVPLLPGWDIELSQDVLLNMMPGEVRLVTLNLTPPSLLPLPPDNTPIIDVEAFANAELIGGIRMIFRPPVPLHTYPEPFYAEREISITPYPVISGDPAEVCVMLRNISPFSQEVLVNFSWANFGIGLPFSSINDPYLVPLSPFSVIHTCTMWIPPVSGLIGLQVSIDLEGYETQVSQRVLDINPLLQPGVTDTLTFPVGNPLDHAADISLGLVPLLPDWGFELSQDVLLNMMPGEVRLVTLNVTPPSLLPLPPDNTPIIDVQAFANAELIGGIEIQFGTMFNQKIFLPLINK